VEIGTALAMGMPALVREGMTWRDLRLRALHAAPVQLAQAARRSEAAEAEAQRRFWASARLGRVRRPAVVVPLKGDQSVVQRGSVRPFV
jgi:hypothetical protein